MPDHPLALITGASSGLGAEYARQLAALGYNLILSARRQSRLVELAENIKSSFPIGIEIIPADLSGNEGIQTIVECICSTTTLDLLINNAGFGVRGKFHQVEPSKHVAMVQVHINATVQLTHAALPGMVNQHHGWIINVASMAGLIPIRSVLYGSTKSFMIQFTDALHRHMQGSIISFQALCPGFTITEFHDTPEYKGFNRRRIPGILWLSADQVVRESLEFKSRGTVVRIPGSQYKIIGAIARNIVTGYFVREIGAKLFHK